MVATALTERTFLKLHSVLGRDEAAEIAQLIGNSGSANTLLEFGGEEGGVLDCTLALRQGLAATASGGAFIVPEGQWLFSQPITVPAGVSFLCNGSLLYTGSGTAVTIGDSSQSNFRQRIRVNVARVTSGNWSSESEIGVKLVNPVDCEINIVRSQGFTIGVQFAAYLATAYNYGVRLGHILGNKISVDLHSYGVNGYINENTFIGGRFTYVSGENTTKSRIGVRLMSEAGCYAYFNKNVFYGPTFELGAADASPATAVPVVILNNAHHNEFLNCRTEGNTATFFTTAVGTEPYANRYTLAYHELSAVTSMAGWSGNRAADIIGIPESELLRVYDTWFSGDLPSKTAQRINSGFEDTNTPGVHWEVSGGSAASNLVASLHLSNDGEYLTPTGSNPAPGIVCDSRLCKRFRAFKRVSAAAPGRFAVRCYDGHPNDGGSIIKSSTPQNISTITNPSGSTIRVTITAHGYTTGQRITIESVGGTTNANGTWPITVITADTFDLVGPTHNSAYTSGGTAGIPLVSGMYTGQNLAWGTNYGGSYVQGSDADAPMFFTLHTDVKYFVLLCQNATIASFSLGTVDPYPISCFPKHGVNDGIMRCSAIPDTPTAAGSTAYKTGQFVLNSAKTSSPTSPFGWYCTSGGLPGTWIAVYTPTILTGSKTFDWPSVADGAVSTTTVTVTGAALGDCAIASLNGAVTAGAFMVAHVTSANTVSVTLFNKTGSPLDLASATLSVMVLK